MMGKRCVLLCISLVLAVMSCITALAQDIRTERLKQDIYTLADDSLKGRKSGTTEGQRAANYILKRMMEIGLKETGGTMVQPFEVVFEVSLGDENALSFKDFDGKIRHDFIPLSFTSNGELQAEVIFTGYGFNIKQDSLQWDDYASADVSGKWAMIFRGHPEPEKSNSKFLGYAEERSKVLVAKDKGAAGVLFVTPKSMEKQDTLVPLFFDKSPATAGIPVINITRKTADLILSRTGKTCNMLDSLFSAGRKPFSFPTGRKLKASADIRQVKGGTQNVMGLLVGTDPVLRDDYIVVGAHYDHLGLGGPSSGSRDPDTLAPHNGADDNASGVAGILSLAEALKASGVKRSIIFVAFSGEEMGLLGSRHFVKNSPVPLSKIKTMFNLDMVGRLSGDTATIMVGGTGTGAETEEILSKYKQAYPFKVNFSQEGYGASDHSSFYGENVPVMFFTTGAHDDYHTPFDDAEKINYDGLKSVLGYVFNVIKDVSDRQEALSFREAGPKNPGGRGAYRFKVTLGILPDMAGSENNGLRVDGTRKEGPAARGGIIKGDIITAINGNPVHNIYEYMERLKTLEAGQVVNIDILRGGKRQVLIIQL